MIVLDSNIVSEPWRPRPDRQVLEWLEAQPTSSLYLCTPVLAELRFGAESLDAGLRRDRLRNAIDRLETESYRGRVFSFDGSAAAEYGRLAAKRRRIGKRMEIMDAMIAAIALTHRAALATRNIGDFSDLGLELVNPFDFGG
jgi:toxin FitB